MTRGKRPPSDPLPGFDALLPTMPVPADFDTFWSCYPNKQGKAEARRHWSRLDPPDRLDAIAALEVWCEFWQLAGTEQRFIPHGSTWVCQRRWEDDVPALPAAKPLTRTPGAAGIDAVRRIAAARQRPRALGQ